MSRIELGQAYGCLSDEEKRKFYDLNGFDSSQPRTPSAQAQQSFYRRRGFTFQDEDEIDPDELFRFFFGGGPFYQPGGRTRVYRFRPQYTQRRYQRNGEDEDDSGNRWGRTGHSPLFGLAMFIGFVLLMNIISGKLSEHQTQEAKYSFNPSARFNVKRNSEIFNVDYYVPSSMFSSKNSKNVKDGTSSKILKDIDFEVDQQYLASLERHARYYGGRSGYYNEYLEAREKMRLWRERKVKSQSDTKFSFEADGEFVERRVSSVFQVEYYVKPSSDSEAPGEGTSNLKEINDIDLDVDKYYLNTLVKKNLLFVCVYLAFFFFLEKRHSG